MTILNLNGPSGKAPRTKNTARAWMGIGLVFAVLGIGSTLAGSITINPSGNTEFGQGVEKTVFCGSENQTLIVSPSSNYRNSSSGSTLGTFFLSGIKVSSIPSACDGINFVFSIYDDEATTPLTIVNPGTAVKSLTVYWRSGTASNTNRYVTSSDRTSLSNCQKASSTSSHTTNFGGLLSLSEDSYSSPCAAAYLTVTSASSFQINLRDLGSTSTNPDVKNASRIVVETQNDAFGVTTLATSSGASFGLVSTNSNS